MPGVTPNLSVAALKRDGCNAHSVSLLDRRDSLSASVFSLPGMCTTVSQTLRDMHHSQICLAIVFPGVACAYLVYRCHGSGVIYHKFNMLARNCTFK